MEANIQELEELDIWLRDDNNLLIFNQFVKIEYLTTSSMTEFDINKAKASINNRLKKDKLQRRFMFYKKMTVAASILLILGISFFSRQKEIPETIQIESSTVLIETGSNKAILTLDNGNQVFLQKGKKIEAGKASSNGEELIYGNDEVTASDKILSYNYLKVPRGGQFFVQLSDGTKVWLNSDSELKYPVTFQHGHAREVELLYGEAYFEVSPSTMHSGMPFYVHTKSQTVDVLGTVFNIKAYNDEFDVKTTLVEGKIKILNGNKARILKPSQQSKVLANNSSIDIIEVDVSQEISWVKGLFTFNEANLASIMTNLSRWYDFEIVFETGELKNCVFTGVLERTKRIEDVLKLIEATSEKQVNFEIKDKTITIK